MERAGGEDSIDRSYRQQSRSPTQKWEMHELGGVGGLDGAGEPDVDEDGVSIGRNCDDRTSVVLAVLSVSRIHPSMP